MNGQIDGSTDVLQRIKDAYYHWYNMRGKKLANLTGRRRKLGKRKEKKREDKALDRKMVLRIKEDPDYRFKKDI